MIIPDVNILVYANDRLSPYHERARTWLEGALCGSDILGLPAVSALGFVRLLSNPKVVQNPVSPSALLSRVGEWLDLPACRAIGPGARHFEIMRELFERSNAPGTLTTDIHLAALAIEHRAQLCSNDSDFSRFRGLKIFNPLAD